MQQKAPRDFSSVHSWRGPNGCDCVFSGREFSSPTCRDWSSLPFSAEPVVCPSLHPVSMLFFVRRCPGCLPKRHATREAASGTRFAPKTCRAFPNLWKTLLKALVLVVLPDMCQLPKAGKTRVQQYFGLSIFDVDLMCPNKIDPPKQAVFTRSLCGLLHW